VIDAARDYLRRGLAPIPVAADKRPLVKWEPFQSEAPHADQVDESGGRNGPRPISA
jgi:hypothetical protein